jgi:hypothetical protein
MHCKYGTVKYAYLKFVGIWKGSIIHSSGIGNVISKQSRNYSFNNLPLTLVEHHHRRGNNNHIKEQRESENQRTAH